jgi:hypothetical protein
MDLPEIQVALELFKLLPTQKSTSDGVLTQMTVDERLAVFEKCCAAVRRAKGSGPSRRPE